jgi:PAS domain S-box-containing protein
MIDPLAPLPPSRKAAGPGAPQGAEAFRLLVEGVTDYAIFMLDPTGRVLTWNAGAAAIKGYAADEVLLRDFSMFFTAEDAAAGKPEQDLATALGKGRARSEGYRVRKDGSLFWADIVITPVLDRDGMLRGFASVTRDLSAQRRLAELERASQRMNEFIAMLAHELRNPLAPIRNAVSVMKMQQGLPPAVVHMNEIVDRQAAHLTRLVDDLLDVGRVVSGKILLRRQQIDYREVVQAGVEAVRPQAEARRHRLVLELPDAVQMWGDAMRLTQALQNLLHNAIRYTPDGGEIRVALRLEGARSVTTVTDTGQGIAPEALERIFELFVQEDGVRRAPSESGLGIGLSLARSMAELHGGRLSASSEGPGRGSTFTMVLPTRQPVPAAGRT